MRTIYYTFIAIFFASVTFAQSEADLAKATQSPLAAMYSLPFQNNTTYGNEPFNRPQNVLNIQPVLPFSLSDKINLVNRIILPVITQPSTTEDKSTTGTGDISWSAWLSPSNASKIIWGVGPVMQIPTASSSEFGIGPSFVALTVITNGLLELLRITYGRLAIYLKINLFSNTL